MVMTKITSTVSVLSEVLSSRCFVVPWHQRYFDWNKEQVRDLTDDIGDAVNRKISCYFVGSIMLVESTDGSECEVNDGQQRLITLSLLIAAFARRFSKTGDNNETVALRALFDRPDNQASRMIEADSYKPRVRPSRLDDHVYRQVIRGHDVGTNGGLVDAFDVIQAFVQQMHEDNLVEFFDFLMRRTEMSVLTIPTTVDANSFFEALNARGKPLSDVDLIRNRLYSYFSDANDVERRKTVHASLEGAVVVARSTRKVEDYFRCYLQCQYGHLRKNRLYRDVRQNIDEVDTGDVPSYVLRLVEGLGSQSNVELFRMIASTGADPGFRKHLSFSPDGLGPWMHDLRRYTVSYPVIFALLHRLSIETDQKKKRKTKKLVLQSLNNLASFVLRTAFVAPKFEPSRFDAPLANLGAEVFGNSTIESLNIMNSLERADDLGVVSDNAFVRQMEVVQFRDRRRALMYLFGINATMQATEAIQRSGCSVEHVLPQSHRHWAGWPAFDGREAYDYVHRTGNMVVLPKSENRADAPYNGDYKKKRDVFRESSLSMARQLASQYDKWTPEVIEERSLQLAHQAAHTWRFL